MKNQNFYLPEDVLVPHFSIEKKIVGVEIGVSGGCGSVVMLKRLPNLKLYCIDPWKHIDGAPFEASLPQESLDRGYADTKHRLSAYTDRVIILRKASDAAIKDVPDIVDFVHLDGDHQHEQVVKDIKNYFPKIRIGGLISGHDYESQIGVSMAVNELFKDYKIYHGDDWVWWVYKDKEITWKNPMVI